MEILSHALGRGRRRLALTSGDRGNAEGQDGDPADRSSPPGAGHF